MAASDVVARKFPEQVWCKLAHKFNSILYNYRNSKKTNIIIEKILIYLNRFDDCDIMYPNANGSMHGAATPIKRKKLFDSSDSD